MTLDQAYQICREITISHYENFPVASRLLPAQSRKHIYPIYAFARHADDLADEAGDREGLLAWREMLHRCLREAVGHPIFQALADTIRRFELPVELFDDLLSAFLQDIDQQRYPDMAALLDYCRRSANPVGRIILYLHGYRDTRLMTCSDDICTALQLTNFWQDVQVDITKSRIYIPQDWLARYRVSEDSIIRRRHSREFAALMEALLKHTRRRFASGKPLLAQVQRRLRWELRFTVGGGLRILDKIEQNDYNVLEKRPILNKGDWLLIALRTLI